MDFFSGLEFFLVLVCLAVPAILLGLREKKIKYYGLIASIIVLYLIYGDSIQGLMLLLFIAYSLLLIHLHLFLTVKKGRLFGQTVLFVLLVILPLVIAKFGFSIGGTRLEFLGISYLTFRIVQIILETYDGLIKKMSFFDTAYFLLFFPTISSGPIDRSKRFASDTDKSLAKEEYLKRLGIGIEKIIAGLFYKFVLSSYIYGYMMEWQSFSFIPNMTFRHAFFYYLIKTYLYSGYLFFDFAGYSLMAIGAGGIFGVNVPRNFHFPFMATSIKDFWNRWHMSLSFWFRDYVFTRLVVFIRKKKWLSSKLTIAFIAYMVNMGLMGIWHGIATRYILYGLYHGLILGINNVYEKKSQFYKRHHTKKWYTPLSWFITLHLVVFGFFLFSGIYF